VIESRTVPVQTAARPARLATLSALLVLAAMIAASRYARAEDIRFALEMAGWSFMVAMPRLGE